MSAAPSIELLGHPSVLRFGLADFMFWLDLAGRLALLLHVSVSSCALSPQRLWPSKRGESSPAVQALTMHPRGANGALAVKRFTGRAETVAVHMICKRLEKRSGSGWVVVRTQMRKNKWAEQLAPDRSLMIGSVTFPPAASIVSRCSTLAREQQISRPNSMRGSEPCGVLSRIDLHRFGTSRS